MKVINRIKTNEDFALTIKNGRSLRNESFTLIYRKTELNRIRIGISVSKKIGNAVTRNKVKRQVRAMCDSLFDYNSGSIDVVLIIKNGFLLKNFHENKAILQNCISEVNLGVTK